MLVELQTMKNNRKHPVIALFWKRQKPPQAKVKTFLHKLNFINISKILQNIYKTLQFQVEPHRDVSKKIDC